MQRWCILEKLDLIHYCSEYIILIYLLYKIYLLYINTYLENEKIIVVWKDFKIKIKMVFLLKLYLKLTYIYIRV